jgi:hypothetical protein
MLCISDREKEGWLDSFSIENFSCTDLRTLNQLWVQASNGRFGFSIQNRIYEEVGKDSTKLAKRVGWKVEGKWLRYNELRFSEQAPVGHLPAFVGWGGWWGLVLLGYSSLAKRLETCHIPSQLV